MHVDVNSQVRCSCNNAAPDYMGATTKLSVHFMFYSCPWQMMASVAHAHLGLPVAV